MDTCKYKHCSEDPLTPLYRCDGCAKNGIHVLCFTGLKQRSTYGDLFVFCSVACVDTGPIILSADLNKIAGKLNKAQLKSYLRSKDQRVVDEHGKDVSKSVLIDTLVEYSNQFIVNNEECSRFRTHKTPNCDFRLLNILFNDEYAERFQATGATMSREELDAQNGASEVTFWDLVSEAYNNREDDRFDQILFDSPKFIGINPKLFVNHSAAKLQQMWKKINKQYGEARRKYQKSGTHNPDFASAIAEEDEDDFEDFTDYAAVCYLRKHLERKPGLNELVVRKLDDSISLESVDLSEQEMNRRDSVSSNGSNWSARKKRKKDDIAEAISQLADNRKQHSDFDKVRMELMQKNESRLDERLERENEKMEYDKKHVMRKYLSNAKKLNMINKQRIRKTGSYVRK
jgi:hypothetical protein